MTTPLERVEVELDRIGLLLQHDQQLPSATAVIAGGTIRGSWWGHALGHQIYAVLLDLERRSGALCLKLVNGKLTYVHPKLYASFFAELERQRPAALEGCTKLARELLQLVERDGCQRVDALQLASAKECTAAARELESLLLLHTASEHGEDGKHRKTLETWNAWRARHQLALETVSADLSRRCLREAVEKRLAQGAVRRPRLALAID